MSDAKKRVDTGAIHTLVIKREDRYQKYMEARNDYDKACEELREAINALNSQKAGSK